MTYYDVKIILIYHTIQEIVFKNPSSAFEKK